MGEGSTAHYALIPEREEEIDQKLLTYDKHVDMNVSTLPTHYAN